MPFRKRTSYLWAILLAAAVLIRLSAIRKDWVEAYYSGFLYPAIGSLYRFLFGWIPFSIGDILYITAGIWLLISIYKGFRQLRQQRPISGILKSGLLWVLAVSLLVYISFNFLWGLNYNRKGIAWQMNLQVKDTASSSLIHLTSLLRDGANSWKPATKADSGFVKSREEAIKAYQSLQKSIPYLYYHPGSVKPSLFGVLGNYMGYSGYYNPFSGEAQLNTHIPSFLVPFSTCHEIAHQLGYAKENEANFVGYLAARESADSSMRYSAYLNMFLYANNELRYMDSALARENFEQLSEPGEK